jgi:tetratricopeptide (TPR) repeat protein
MFVELIPNLARTLCDFGFVHTNRISVISIENVLPDPAARRTTSLNLTMHSFAELFDKGFQLKENKDYRGAIEAFHAAIQLQWNLTAAHIEQGNCASLLGQHGRALEFYSSAIETDQTCAIACYNTGLTWLDLRNHEQAYAWFVARTIEIDRTYRLAYLRLAQLHANAPHDRSAITLLIRAAQIEPKIAAPLVAAGTLYYKNTDTVRAVRCFEKALRIDAWNTDAYYYLGLTYYRQGDFARAVRSLSLAVNSDSSNKLARTLLKRAAKQLQPKRIRTAPIQTDLFHATAHRVV